MVQEKPFIIGFQILVYYLVSGKNQETFFRNNISLDSRHAWCTNDILEGKQQDKA